MKNYKSLVYIVLVLISWAFSTNFSFAQEYRRKRKAPTTNPSQPQYAPIKVSANTTLVQGQVLDAATGEPLPGAQIKLLELDKGTVANFDGNFSFEGLKKGKYVIEASMLGYQPRRIIDLKVTDKPILVVKILLEETADLSLEAVVIEDRLRPQSDAALTTIQRNALQVSDGFSGDLILRESPDLFAGTMLRRMPGITLLEEKYLVIRGLSERFNLVTFNNTLLPITDLERVSFDFNIIPAGQISSIRILKTVTADMISETGGGMVQFNTVAIPEKNSVRAFALFDFNSRTTFRDFQKYETNERSLGIFSSVSSLSANLPSIEELRRAAGIESNLSYQAARSVPNNVAPITQIAPLGINVGVSIARLTKLNAKTPFGFSASINYMDNYRQETSKATTVLSYSQELDKNPVADEQVAERYIRKQVACVLLNAGLEFGTKGKLNFNNMFSYQGENMASEQDGLLSNPFVTDASVAYKLYPLRFLGRKLYSGQINFDYRTFNNRNWNWTLHAETGYSFLRTDEPGYRGTTFVFDDSLQKFIFANAGFYSRVLTATQTDNILTNKVSTAITHEFSPQFSLTLTPGIFTKYTHKDYTSRLFYLLFAYDNRGRPITDIPIAQLTNENLANIYQPANIRPNGINFYDATGNFDNYRSASVNVAPFVMFDVRAWKRLRLNAGLRIETFNQYVDISPLESSIEQRLVNKRHNDILPSISAIYSLSNKINLRAAYAVTLNRPIDRELLPIIFFNLNYGTRSLGNPQLLQSKIQNYDIRFEYFPGGSDVLSATVFFKQFENPIEQRVTESLIGGAQLFDLANRKNAIVGGIELELRKNLGKLPITVPKWLESMTIYGNLTLLRSRIDSMGINNLFTKGRALQGQADFTLNAGIIYNDNNKGVSLAAFYNYVGKQLTVVGSEGRSFPSFYELGRQSLDLQAGKTFGKHLELRLSFVNLINAPIRWVQIIDPEGNYEPSRDQQVREIKQSWDAYISVGYKF